MMILDSFGRISWILENCLVFLGGFMNPEFLFGEESPNRVFTVAHLINKQNQNVVSAV